MNDMMVMANAILPFILMAAIFILCYGVPRNRSKRDGKSCWIR